ncbi:D-alanyl-D-alanine carboxypeptidase family protein [[Brevibacterium] frigoritolerans]|nr:D-alanyl-D-alanine carboxypeptidase family protein [Peribacillus frigoritolerans]
MGVFLKFAAKMLMKYFKDQAKKMATDKLRDSGILKVIAITLLSITISIPLLMGGLFGSLLCPAILCDDNTDKKEDVISIAMLKEISGRMVQLRTDTNNDATDPGENYGTFNVKLFENAEKPNMEIENQEEALQQINSTPDVPIADPDKWVTGKKEGLNAGFLNRLAAIAQANGKKVSITSGHRSVEKQRELYEGYIKGLPGYNQAAKPGMSRHNYGLAADVSGWLQQMPETALLPYGLHKPVGGENWHVEPKETKGKPITQLKGVKIDGIGATVAGSEGGDVSEAYIHLLALQQADESELGFITIGELKNEEKKKTNIGLTWKLAKAIKKEVENKTYKDADGGDINKRAKDENWKSRQYLKLARWEIQKCFLIGDKSSANFFENLFGGPKPCAEIKRLTGEEIVPEKLQGVISKTKIENKDDKVVIYQDVQDILYKYADISLYKNKKQFEPVMKEILELMFERFAAPQTLSGFEMPTFIAPMEAGTYTVFKKYGEAYETDDGKNAKGVVMKSYSTGPVYSSFSGKIVGLYKDSKGKYTVVLSHPSNGFIEYKGLSEVLQAKGKSVIQGQLIGAITKDDLFEFRVCSEASVELPKPTCENSTDPQGGEAKIEFTNSIDKKKADERAKSYPKWKKDGGVILMPGFSPLGSLGQLSKKYESSGDPGICVHNAGDRGGLSCGSYQIAKNPGTLAEFMKYLARNYPEYYKQLASVPQNIGSFGPAWRKVYESDKEGFYQAQHGFIGQSHYVDITNKIKKKYGFDANTRSRAVMDMFWSYSVQHRNNTTIAFGAVVGNKWEGMSDKDMIIKMYDYRIAKWSCCTTRFKSEKKDALAMLAAEQ